MMKLWASDFSGSSSCGFYRKPQVKRKVVPKLQGLSLQFILNTVQTVIWGVKNRPGVKELRRIYQNTALFPHCIASKEQAAFPVLTGPGSIQPEGFTGCSWRDSQPTGSIRAAHGAFQPYTGLAQRKALHCTECFHRRTWLAGLVLQVSWLE